MLRPAKYKDFGAIKQIFAISFNEEYKQRGLDIVERINRWQQLYPVVKLLSTFNNPYQYLFNVHVYEDPEENRIVGLIQTTARNRDHTRWHIENIAVLPDQRGKGVAQKILNHIFDMYSEKGVNRFTLEVDVNNAAAIKLYEKTAFRKYTTIHYYKLPGNRLREFGKKETVSVPEGFREYRPGDAQNVFDLYVASTPSSIRIVDQKNLVDFQESPLEKASKYMKEYLKKSAQKHFVVEKNGQIVASLEIAAQYRMLPHVIRLLVNPGFEEFNETLLNYAFCFLSGFPERSVLVAASEHQKAKLEAIKKMKLKHISSDFLMVRDNLQIVKLAETNSEAAIKLEKKNNFKPIFSNHDAIRKDTR